MSFMYWIFGVTRQLFQPLVEILQTIMQQSTELLVVHLLLADTVVLLPQSPVPLLQLAVLVIIHLH